MAPECFDEQFRMEEMSSTRILKRKKNQSVHSHTGSSYGAWSSFAYFLFSFVLLRVILAGFRLCNVHTGGAWAGCRQFCARHTIMIFVVVFLAICSLYQFQKKLHAEISPRVNYCGRTRGCVGAPAADTIRCMVNQKYTHSHALRFSPPCTRRGN